MKMRLVLKTRLTMQNGKAITFIIIVEKSWHVFVVVDVPDCTFKQREVKPNL